MNPISQPQHKVAMIVGAISQFSTLTRYLHGPASPSPPGHPAAQLHDATEGLRFAHRLEAPLEVLVVVAVDDGVHAGVGERQPVGEGEDVAGHKVQLLPVQAPIICHHHEGPEWQPGQHEKQSHHNEHLNHLDLFL